MPTYSDVKYTLPPYPRQVRIETSSFCNAGCSWCHAHGEKGLTRQKGKMDRQMITRIIDDIATWPEPLKELVPTNFGELFLHRDWYAILQEIARKLPETKIALVTTGTLLTPAQIAKLATIPTLGYVNFSINAYFRETWERIHKLPAKMMDRAVSNVHVLRDRRPDVDVNVSMVYDPEITTETERERFLAHWTQFGSTTVSHVSFAGHPRKRPLQPVTLSCRSVFDGIVVFDDGNCGTGCCFDGDADPELNIGHFPEEKLLDIWHGEKLKRLCEIHNDGRRVDLKLCKTCSFA